MCFAAKMNKILTGNRDNTRRVVRGFSVFSIRSKIIGMKTLRFSVSQSFKILVLCEAEHSYITFGLPRCFDCDGKDGPAAPFRRKAVRKKYGSQN